MAKGYSIRRTINYVPSIKGGWIGHSLSVHDENGYTRIWASEEEAEEFAIALLSKSTRKENEEGYIQHIKIYRGKEYIKTIDRR